MDTLESRVKKVVAEQLHMDPDRIRAKATFARDLGIDIRDAVELVMAIEKEFGIAISDEQAASLHCVRDMVAFVQHSAGAEKR